MPEMVGGCGWERAPDRLLLTRAGSTINDVTQFWTIFEPLPIVTLIITKALVLLTPPPKTVTSFMNEPNKNVKQKI
jgi:hypothetical protein